VTTTEKFAKNFWAAWNTHDWGKTSPFYADNCIMEDLPSIICNSKLELEAYYDYLVKGYPDLTFKAKSCFGNSNKTATEWTMTGTHTSDTSRFKATGKRFSIPGVSILEIQDGKIIRETDYWDMCLLLQQLGIMPSIGHQ
jgi:steroid delta-isomerase-like uncharacterized protein